VIDKYVAHKVSQVESLNSNNNLQGEVHQRLLDSAERTLLWVDMVLGTVDKIQDEEAVTFEVQINGKRIKESKDRSKARFDRLRIY